MATKGNKPLVVFKRNVKVASRTTRKKAYNTLIKPTLEDTSRAWRPHQRELRYEIKIVQRGAARHVITSRTQWPTWYQGYHEPYWNNGHWKLIWTWIVTWSPDTIADSTKRHNRENIHINRYRETFSLLFWNKTFTWNYLLDAEDTAESS